MKIKINRKKCISCGVCAAMMPEVFELDDEMKSVIKNFKAAQIAPKNKLKEVVGACPVGAIDILI